MMVSHPLMEKYLEMIEEELKDLDKERRKSIVSDVREHIEERVRDVSGDQIEVDSNIVKKVLWDFGPPDEIARNYRMQTIDERTEKKPGRRNHIIAILTMISVVILISAGLFILLRADDERPGTDIVPGKGNDRVEIGNSIEDVIDVYGGPEERIESDNSIWLSYRNLRGIDFLISNQTRLVMEIRFNEGYPGKLQNGIGVGSNISELFDLEAWPNSEYDVEEWLLRYNPGGFDKVLYHVTDDSGNHISNKYLDGINGILYWTTPEGGITQIVVFEPFPEDSVPVLRIDAWIDSEEDSISIRALSLDLNWTWYEVRIDGIVFLTDSNRSRPGEVAVFRDPAGDWDARIGNFYNIKIILVDQKQVVYEDDIITTAE